MNLLIINATPKTDGITYSFVEAAEETAKELDVKYETLRLSGLTLEKCKMCGDGWGICFNDHICVFGDKDGFNELQKKVQKADAFVYITPVYWSEISEEFKIFLDKLRRCQATKQWDVREEEVSFLKGKPSILVANAGGGGGGILTALQDIERAVQQMSGDMWPRETDGIFDYIGVNRWNKEYKRNALKSAVAEMIKYLRRPKAVSVEPRPDYKLFLTFDNGEKRLFDMSSYLETEQYSDLKDINLFNKAKVTGVHIEWRPRLDIGPDPIYFESTPI